jgi:hypothetical protein
MTITIGDSTVNNQRSTTRQFINYYKKMQIIWGKASTLGGKLIVFKSYQETVRGCLTFSNGWNFLCTQLGYKSFTVWYAKPNFGIPWISGYCKFQTLICLSELFTMEARDTLPSVSLDIVAFEVHLLQISTQNSKERRYFMHFLPLYLPLTIYYQPW